MKNNLKVGLTIVILASIAVLLWFFTSGRTTTAPAELPAPEFIKTSKPIRMNMELEANWIGKSQPKQKASIIALTEGTIVAIDVNDEAMVDKGAALFTIRGPVIETKLAGAEEKVSSLQNRLNIAQSTLSRKQQAVSEKISSLDELDAAKTSYEQLKSELESAKVQLLLLQDAAHVTAPIVGIFTGRKVNVGQTVENGTELADIIVPGQVRIVAVIFSEETSGLEGRQITFSSPEGKQISGMITKVMPERTPAGGSTIWINSKEIDEQIKPGQNLSGKLIAAVRHNVLAIQESSIVYDQNDIPYVFLKVDNKFEQKKVQVGLESNGWVEIISGVAPDNEVVSQGAYELYYRNFNKSYKVPD